MGPKIKKRESRIKLNNSFKWVKEENSLSRILFPVKISFEIEDD